MKKAIMFGTALFVIAPLAAQASCESVEADISQKIVNNGVPETGFKLDIVPSDQASQAAGQVVGNCENESHQIIYTRIADGDASVSEHRDAAPSSQESAPAPATQEEKPATPATP